MSHMLSFASSREEFDKIFMQKKFWLNMKCKNHTAVHAFTSKTLQNMEGYNRRAQLISVNQITNVTDTLDFHNYYHSHLSK